MSKNLLDRVSIANPCTTDWKLMTGDERKRYCQQCDKHVYNLSQMTRQQAEALLRQTDGKLCARFERRPDGSILTADKSFSLPRFNTKFLRFASATVSAALSLSPSIAAKPTKNFPVLNSPQDKQDKNETQPQEKDKLVKICGKVFDLSEAIIANVSITATNETTKQIWKTYSSADGEYEFLLPQGDNYSLTFETPGFKKLVRSEINISTSFSLDVTVTMTVGEATMGIVVIVPDVPTAGVVEDLNLRLNARETSPPQTKKPTKNWASILLAPLKKIKSSKNK